MKYIVYEQSSLPIELSLMLKTILPTSDIFVINGRVFGGIFLKQVRNICYRWKGVCRNIFANPVVVPGGGALEMEISQRLTEKSKNISGMEQQPYRAVALALEGIPRTLAQNCGTDVVRKLTELRAKHNSEDGKYWGIDGESGEIVDMRSKEIWDPMVVKSQVVKTAIESSCMLLRIDDIVSGIKKKEKAPQQAAQPNPEEEAEGFGYQRDG